MKTTDLSVWINLFWEDLIPKKLYRCRKNKMIDGVCAGLAVYFNVDPTIVRLAAVLLACMYGSGVLVYLVAACIMPNEPKDNE